ncbi:MAG: hypothetical protein JWO76_1856 [Nocardioides sp.]|nr:hypothetical protein [Nocardioides sp.]
MLTTWEHPWITNYAAEGSLARQTRISVFVKVRERTMWCPRWDSNPD